jgi:hypothetical protein
MRSWTHEWLTGTSARSCPVGKQVRNANDQAGFAID